MEATATSIASHKHGTHASPLPGLKAITSSLLRRFLLHPSDQHRHYLRVTVCLVILLMTWPLATHTGTGALMGSHLSLMEPQEADGVC